MTTSFDRPPERSRLQGFLLWLALVVSVGLLLFFRYYLAELASGSDVHFLKPFIREMTGAFGGGLLFFPVRRLVRSLPLDRRTWPKRLPVYLAAIPIFSAIHTTLNWGLRLFFYDLAGFGKYGYGTMPLRYFMELPGDVVVFWIFVASFHGVARLRAAREQEFRTAQLESSLARAELCNLRLQLQPHFLFNALNTISSTMYDDPAAADEMLDRLAELLRASLKTARSDEVPLATELETLDCYLAIMRARFGDRLEVRFDVEPGTRQALVPSMILQPLVENAIRHGGVETSGRGRIDVRARRGDRRLILEIEDDGPGRPADAELAAQGVGLTATAERLALLYDGAGRFEAGNVEGGGFRVTAVLPFTTRQEPAA